MKKIWMHKAKSFKEAEDFENRYYMEETPEERLSDIQLCRELYFRIKKINANRKRLRRVVRVLQ
ncbi:MAG: hypothetical protein FJZ13_06255 [Candidatus Omnitrophica bacterium]|nr:hypothetical protein [Candidatus Omnitrophota bacterium]